MKRKEVIRNMGWLMFAIGAWFDLVVYYTLPMGNASCTVNSDGSYGCTGNW
jgi:hypothetical protein